MQDLGKKNFSSASLRGSRSAHTVLLRMAADAERAERIRQIKANRPDLTWRRMAEAVGVTERSANDWGKKGSISYENSKKLAAFLDVDADWLWSGPRESADSVDDQSWSTRFDAIEAKLDELLSRLPESDPLEELEQELQDAALEREQQDAGTDASAPYQHPRRKAQ